MRQICTLLLLTGAAMALGPIPIWAEDEISRSETLFNQLDKNADGKLTADEISDAQRRFFDRLVRVGDRDKNGELSRSEFLQALKPESARNESSDADRTDNRRENRVDPRAIMRVLDRNRDGKITKDEIPERARERMLPLFQRSGKDALTVADFERFRGPAEPMRQGQPPSFEQMDRNGDGKVTLDEFPEGRRERARMMFEVAGKDELTEDDVRSFFDRLRSRSRRSNRESGTRAPNGNRAAQTPAMPDRAASDDAKPGDAKPERLMSDRDAGRDANRRPPEGNERRPFGMRQGFRPPAFFRKLDIDEDGRLSKDELAKAVDLLEELDQNEDGSLDFRELFGMPPRGFGGPERRRDRQGDGEREDRGEDQREGQRERRDRPSESPAAEKPNQDERPRRPEADMVNSEQRGVWLLQTLERLFQLCDRDQDGKITSEEAQGRLRGDFASYDTDADGTLSRDEFKRTLTAEMQSQRQARASNRSEE